MKIFSVLTILGGAVGMVQLIGAFLADTYQGQAAGAATAVACVAIPYCVARAIQMIVDAQGVLLNRIINLLGSIGD